MDNPAATPAPQIRGLVRRTLPAEVSVLGEREVEVTVSTSALAQDGDIWLTAGVDLTRFRLNPIFLAYHDTKAPVGRAEEIRVEGDALKMRVVFAPAGISPKADEVCGLVKSRVISAISAGALPIETEPLDPKKPRGGQRWLRWELLEGSFVAIGSNPEALVTARTAEESDWKVGASRNLPIEDGDEAWDGPAAAASIFEWAGGDEFDAKQARKGFLVYDAAKPDERGSYKLPIARVAKDRLVVPKSGIRAAASRLPDTDIPDSVKESAGKVLDHYKEKAGMTEDGEREVADLRRRMVVAAPRLKLRDLYDCAQLAYVLSQLGYLHSSASWEAEVEADDSKVPAMLGEVMKSAGEALIAMTEEEVAEMLSGHGLEMDEEVELVELPAEERAFVGRAATPRLRAWRRGIARARVRSGRTLSGANVKQLENAAGHHDKAAERGAEAKGHLEKLGAAQEAASDLHGRAATAHDKLGDALAAAKDNPDQAAQHVGKAIRHHHALGKQLDGIGEQHEAAADAHADAADATGAACRSIRGAQRCVRAILDTADGEEAALPEDAEDTAAGRAADLHRRQAVLRELAAAGA